MYITKQEIQVGGQCPFNYLTTALKSCKCPGESRAKNSKATPVTERGAGPGRQELTGAGGGGEASIRAGGTAIKTTFTGGKRRQGKSFPKVRRCCSLREIVGSCQKVSEIAEAVE